MSPRLVAFLLLLKKVTQFSLPRLADSEVTNSRRQRKSALQLVSIMLWPQAVDEEEEEEEREQSASGFQSRGREGEGGEDDVNEGHTMTK